jgi:hypothetical protein
MQAVATTKFMFPDGTRVVISSYASGSPAAIIFGLGYMEYLRNKSTKVGRQASFLCFKASISSGVIISR